MTLTWLDCLALVPACVAGYVLGYLLFITYAQWKARSQRLRHEALNERLKKHPRYPFNLPMVETHPAGEFTCEECGRINYYSMIRVAPQEMPEGEWRDKVERGPIPYEGEEGRGVTGHATFRAPLVVQCRSCKALMANGDAAPMFRRKQSEEVNDEEC